MIRIPQSVALRVPLKAFSDSDGVTAATGKMLAVVISKNGAAFGNPSAGATNATEIANGWYYVDLSTTDTGTAGPLIVRATGTGVQDVEYPPLLVADAHNAGFDGVPSAVAGATGGLPLAADSSGRVDAAKLAGQTITAAAGVTFPSSVASPTNITAATGVSLTSAYDPAKTAAQASDIPTSNITAIKAKTDNLPSDPADASDIAASFTSIASTLSTIAGYIDTEVAAIKAKTDNLPSDPADASDIAGAFSTVNSTLSTIAGYIDTEVAAIKAKTDNLPSDPADASDIAASFTSIASTLSTIAGYIDTEVAAIKAKTDNLPASPAATGDIPTADITAIKAKTDNLPTSPAAVGSAMTLTSAYDAAKTAAQPGDEMDLLDTPNVTAVAAIQSGLSTLDASDIPTAAENAAGLLDLAAGIETGLTPRQAMRLMVAALSGKLSGAETTTITIRNAVADSKDRITATVDSFGNRSAITLDLS